MNPSIGRKLLIAEDDEAFRETLALEFEDLGYKVLQAHSFAAFEALLAITHLDYAVVDLKLGSDSGLAIVQALAQAQPHCRIVVLTGYGSIATAVQAMKLGARNYLTKPASTTRINEAMLDDGASAASLGDTTAGDDPVPSLARQEREYIEEILVRCGGNVSQAARQLGLHRQSLQRKLRKFPPAR